jgi:serine/threonine-protein kinase RsbW
VIAIPLATRLTKQDWSTVSFASTLYLCPIIDLLLTGVPARWRAELRLGLQEALVNAAKHGNQLDPSKKVFVRYSIHNSDCCWVISDQGEGFTPPVCSDQSQSCLLPQVEQECGRGLFILYQIFDQVQWDQDARELKLLKQVRSTGRSPVLT